MISITKITNLPTPFKLQLASSINGSINLYSYGKDNFNGSINLYSLGNGSINSGINLYSYGKAVINGGVDLYAVGRYPYKQSGLDLYTFADTKNPNSSLDLYAYSSPVGSFGGGVELYAKVPEGTSLNCTAFGPAYLINQGLDLYSFGNGFISGGINLSVPSVTTDLSGSLKLYACGW